MGWRGKVVGGGGVGNTKQEGFVCHSSSSVNE